VKSLYIRAQTAPHAIRPVEIQGQPAVLNAPSGRNRE
jgi:hypothetical protein